jgi:hypothetical protein
MNSPTMMMAKKALPSIRSSTGPLQHNCDKCAKKWQLLQWPSLDQAKPISVQSYMDKTSQPLGHLQTSTSQQLIESRLGHDFSRIPINRPSLNDSSFPPVSRSSHLMSRNLIMPRLGDGIKIMTILYPRQSPRTYIKSQMPSLEYSAIKYEQVWPKSSVRVFYDTPGVFNKQGTTKPDSLNVEGGWESWLPSWELVSADENNWGVNIKNLILTGEIKIHPWPSMPNQMIIPNTPNPVDGGNINNIPESPNYWRTVINELYSYNTKLPPKPANWHATEATVAHEWAHWNIDLIEDSVMSNRGGNWPEKNLSLDALREPKSSSPTPGDAINALNSMIVGIIENYFIGQVNGRFLNIPDEQGEAGSTGFEAGQRVLYPFIDDIQNYASSKGWIGSRTSAGTNPSDEETASTNSNRS